MNYQLRILMAMLVLASVGCAGVKNSMRISEKNSIWNPVNELVEKRKSSQEEEASPETMAVIWKDAVLQQPGQAMKRGFGGRIYFYDANSNAVPAEGELVVYAFDSESENPSKADRKFVFRKDEFKHHFSESPLGASYSVWLPWDEFKDSYSKSVTLIPFFITEDGRRIKTSQSINSLKGELSRPETVDDDQPFKYLGASSAVVGRSENRSRRSRSGNARSNQGAVRSASFDQAGTSTEVDDPKSNLRVTELKLTRSLQQQIATAPRQPHQESGDGTGALSQVSTGNQLPWNDVDSRKPAAKAEQPVADSENKPFTRPAFGRPGPIQSIHGSHPQK